MQLKTTSAVPGLPLLAPLPVIDSHVHFWDPAVLDYPWLRNAPGLQRAFHPDDLPGLSSERLGGVIAMEAACRVSQRPEEVTFLEALAATEPRIVGIVAAVDLLQRDGRPQSLALLREQPRVVGVRHGIRGHARGFSLQQEFVRGVREVGEQQLTFDLRITADQLLEASALVRQCPDTVFVLDHCGSPAIRNNGFEPWATNLARLAESENVSCKLSGLFTEARPEQCVDDGLFRYARHAMSCFGGTRLMYGSDWPVVTSAVGEPVWRTFTDRFTADWTRSAREAFYGGNAARIYRPAVEVPS